MLPVRQKNRKETGLTILEVVVSIGLMGLIAAGVFTAFVFGGRVTSSSTRHSEAMRAAQETAEELQRAVRPDLGAPPPPAVGLPVNLQAGTNKPHVLPTGHPLRAVGGQRTYTVVHGRYERDSSGQYTGNIIWQGQEAQGDPPITDADHDLSRVDIKVTYGGDSDA